MKVDKKTIFIPIEIYYREFNQRLYLISKLIRNNYRVYIGTKYGIDQILNKKIQKKEYGGIFFYKGNIIQNKKYWLKIEKTCDNFVALDEELGPAVPNKRLSLSIRANFDKRINKFFVLGNNWKKEIIKKDKRFKDIIVSSGWPKFDLITDKNFKYYDNQASIIKKKYGNFFLFSSNFGTLSKNGLKKMMKIMNKNYSKEFCRKRKIIFENNLKNFRKFVREINYYYKNNGKNKIVIRPHPSEFYHTDWKQNTLKIKDKVKIIYDNDIVPWIIASKGLIHRGCGTALDAFFLKKKIYYWSPEKKDININEKNLTYNISHKINRLSDLERSFKKININTDNLKKNVENFKNINSSAKIVKELNKLKTSKNFTIEKQSYLRIISLYNLLKYNIKKLLNIKYNQKIPEIIKEENIRKFYKNLKFHKNIFIEKVNTEAILIELKK